MGQEQSTNEKTQEYKQFLLFYSQEREAIHPQFGTIKLFTHIQTNEQICLKKYFTKSEKEFSNLVAHLRQRNTFEQDNLLKILAIHQQDQIKICSDQSQITIIIQYYQENLSNEMSIRKLNNKPYNEGHIWILLQQIIDPCTYLSERNIVHGDIKPSTLYLDENGCIKIAECCMLNDGINGYQKMILSQDKAYLSPILLQQYKELIMSPIHDEQKSDIYSLGLTALSVILMEEVYDCFDYIQGIVLTDKLESKFIRIKQLGYSQILIEFIKQLLLFDEQQRPSWQMLKDFIDKYREKINNMIPFYQNHLNNQKSPIRQSNQFNKSPLRQNMIYLPLNKSPQQQFQRSQQFNTSRSEAKPKYVQISKENY
ncbi:unnamed protein product [Paramecium pentaurelia]|uniref:Protein kinase domain-containing protein n=1 Tax=Paramecium pentaurelia TaxID=43138 RepID=A0A8S1RZR5_9CILI|nr:unnamed protein product [Paramecium pentaurelia]